jgi:signal transduction histidine kinase
MNPKPAPSILIVDDNPTNVKVLFDMLESEGCRPFVARSGEDAIDKLEVLRPDLILLDVMMEGIDGFETCRRIKANPATAIFPVIFMTALSDVEDKVKGFRCGAVDYIAKPFQQDEVLARVRIHLELYYLRQQLEAQVAQRTQDLTLALQEVEQARQDLQDSQLRMIQSEKMSALGNLVAGVAHEINNPINCIVGNVEFVDQSVQQLFKAIDLYDSHSQALSPEVRSQISAIDLDYLRDDLPKLVKSMRDGGDRIITISKSLCTFSRADADIREKFDIHAGLESTILILRHRLKANEHRPAIEVVTDYGDIPLIEGFPGQINQVFMNILANAIDALDEAVLGQSPTERPSQAQRITIRTAAGDNGVKVLISDNGKGIPDAVKGKIFDHLFTTKPAGKGTGLGLAIVQQIIEKHHGTIAVQSSPGSGTEFTLTLPLG